MPDMNKTPGSAFEDCYIADPLTLREGGYYRRRDGVVVGPLKKNDPMSSFPWRSDGGYTYDSAGFFIDKGTPRNYDLIAEVAAPTDTVAFVTEREEIRYLNKQLASAEANAAHDRRRADTLAEERDSWRTQYEALKVAYTDMESSRDQYRRMYDNLKQVIHTTRDMLENS